MERMRGLGDGLLKEEKKKWRRGGDLIGGLEGCASRERHQRK